MTWTRKLLELDLNSKTSIVQDIPKRILQTFIGGKGLGALLLHKYQDPKLPPGHPDSIICITTGPIQGVLPIAGRFCIVSKAPLTGMFMDNHIGGFMGPELKMAGFDAIVIQGALDNPGYIYIENETVEFHDATEFVGKDIGITTDYLISRHPRSRVAAIGPAGENLVDFAVVNADYYRTAARGGIGKLFGIKKLKAIAIRGTNKVQVSIPMRKISSDINRRAKQSTLNGHLLPKLGSSWLVEIANTMDQLPTMNYSAGEWEKAGEISGERIHDRYKSGMRRKPCYHCSLACAYLIEGVEWAERPIQHPEYESLGLLGSNLGINDLDGLLKLNHLCNMLGIDTISSGSTIAWFMECGKRNVIPDEFVSEKVEFGDLEGTIKLVEKIAYKRGVGEVLGRGVRQASDVLKNGSENWAVHVRGLELPAWDPRGKLGLGLSYITSNVGGSHLRGWPVTPHSPDREITPEVIDSMIEQQNLKILKDSLIMCHFTHSIKPGFNLEDARIVISALFEREVTRKELDEIANGIWHMSRYFNVKAWDDVPRKTDTLVPRLLEEPLPSGTARGLTAFSSDNDLEQALDVFYEKRDCTKEGIPREFITRQLDEKIKEWL